MRELQIAIAIDSTGSMSSALATVRRNVVKLLTQTFSKSPNIRVSITFFGDYCDNPEDQIQMMDFSSDIAQLEAFVKKARSTGGGDWPEFYEKVLQEYSRQAWNPEALKILCVIGDAIPHDRQFYDRHASLPYIDWKAEVASLKDKGIQIYSIQALSNGVVESPEYKFYSHMAHETNGIHMQLQQFSQICDVLEMVILDLIDQAEDSDYLSQYKTQNNIRNHGMLKAYCAIKRQPQDAVIADFAVEEEKKAPAVVKKGARRAAVGTLNLDAVSTLECAPAAKYQVMDVDEDCEIDAFVKKNALVFKIGCGFYEFTKPSVIQNDKLVVAFNKVTGQLYEGVAARTLFGLKSDCTARQKPIPDDVYVAFIQSCSHNRKLLAGTKFLYIAADYRGDLPEFKASFVPLTDEQKEKTKLAVDALTAALEQVKAQVVEIKAVRESLVDANAEPLLQSLADGLKSLFKF